MMTVTEADLIKQAAEKARSASFSVPVEPSFPQQELGATSVVSYSQQELGSHDGQQCQLVMPSAANRYLNQEDSGGGSNSNSQQGSSKNLLKAVPQSRRSQSCRVASSKNASRPKVRRRLQTQGDDSNSSSTANLESGQDSIGDPPQQRTTEDDSYNPFLRKVPSLGRLLALAPEDCMYVQDDGDDSPVPLRRSASARRPAKNTAPYTDSPVDNSPTPPRHPRQQPRGRGSSRRPGPSVTRKGAALLEVRDPNDTDSLDADQYLLRNFSTTHKGKNLILTC